jgi:hypothetical protein
MPDVGQESQQLSDRVARRLCARGPGSASSRQPDDRHREHASRQEATRPPDSSRTRFDPARHEPSLRCSGRCLFRLHVLHRNAPGGNYCGFVAPFIQQEIEWDFCIERVKSINASGHKYGLAPLGVGWVVWRSKADLPEPLIFYVDYLGGNMATFALNFSRPGGEIIAQYYNSCVSDAKAIRASSRRVQTLRSGSRRRSRSSDRWNSSTTARAACRPSATS